MTKNKKLKIKEKNIYIKVYKLGKKKQNFVTFFNLWTKVSTSYDLTNSSQI